MSEFKSPEERIEHLETQIAGLKTLILQGDAMDIKLGGCILTVSNNTMIGMQGLLGFRDEMAGLLADVVAAIPFSDASQHQIFKDRLARLVTDSDARLAKFNAGFTAPILPPADPPASPA